MFIVSGRNDSKASFLGQTLALWRGTDADSTYDISDTVWW
jgi:hypothetical protein